MMSMKWTFSFLTLMLVGLLIAVPPALANKVTLSIVDADPDGQPAATGDIGTAQKARGDNQADILGGKTGIQVIAGETISIKLTAEEVMVASSIEPTDFVLVGDTAVAIEATGIPATNGKEITITLGGTAGTNGQKLEIYLQPNTIMSAITGRADNTAASVMFEYVSDDLTGPVTVDIVRSDGATHPIFENMVTFTITLSEEPLDGKFTAKDHLVITEATVSSLHAVGTMDDVDADGAPDGDTNDFGVGSATGVDDNIYLYALTLTPTFAKADAIKIKVKKWKDQYGNEAADEKEVSFQVASSAVVKTAATAGKSIGIPDDLMIPAGGALVIAKDDGDGTNSEEKVSESLIMWPGDPKAAAADIALRAPNLRTYNVIEANLPNLETFLINGGTIDLIASDKVIISEIMWGTDTGSQNRQWIEIMNTTDTDIKTKGYKLMLYTANEAVPVTTEAVAAVAATATTVAVAAIPVGSVPADVADRVGTIYKGAYWSIAGRGQSGNISGTLEIPGQDVEIVGAMPLISMQRGAANADGEYPMGTMASSWSSSTPPSQNFVEAAKGLIVGTPGASPIISDAAAKAAADAATAAAKAAAAAAADMSVPMPSVGQIYISEVMFAGGGTLPQWIEISNGSRTEQVNLSGWTLTVNNAATDTDVSVGASIKFTIPEGTKIDPSGQNDTPSTVLVVTETGRNNLPTNAPMINLWQVGQTELILADVTKRRYSLLSDEAFEIVLAPPAPKATKVAATATAAEKAAAKAADTLVMMAHAEATDIAGNLGADGGAAWPLPMSEEGGRSSILLRHVPVSVGPAEPEDGTMMESWVLASDTSFVQATHIRVSSYYGAMNDVGTPGFRAGGALPVELSSFRPARQKDTGQVVITWSTQSELNNAGFFIKRSQQRDGEFKVINATMIAGAGTTSEKQFYTYTDTTAQPNVVYYYQIEDVSLDGNRQTLTRGIRLKGHVGAAGKEVSTWGELKATQ